MANERERPSGLVSIIWLRPEFENQWEKLINLADAATRAEVTRPAISNWRRRYPDFPAAVVEQHDDQDVAIRVWISTEEFDTWRATRTGPTGKRTSRGSTVRKLTQQLAAIDEKLNAACAVVDDLESKRAEIQDALTKALADAHVDAAAARETLDRRR